MTLLIVWALVLEKFTDGFKGHRTRILFTLDFVTCHHPRTISLMSTHPEVSTQFTEDAFAKKEHYCECPKCGALICQGKPEFYIATIDPGQHGRLVCGNCNRHYLRKPSTTVHCTGVYLITIFNLVFELTVFVAAAPDQVQPSQPPQSASYTRPDPRQIQQSVNAVQRGGEFHQCSLCRELLTNSM